MSVQLFHATGVWVREVPFTPGRVWRALRARSAVSGWRLAVGFAPGRVGWTLRAVG